MSSVKQLGVKSCSLKGTSIFCSSYNTRHDKLNVVLDDVEHSGYRQRLYLIKQSHEINEVTTSVDTPGIPAYEVYTFVI